MLPDSQEAPIYIKRPPNERLVVIYGGTWWLLGGTPEVVIGNHECHLAGVGDTRQQLSC